MKKFRVTFNVWVEYSTEVEAESKEEASEIAYDRLQAVTVWDCNNYSFDADIVSL